MLRRFIFLLMLLAPGAASAEWREARSANFVVYSEGPADQLREVAETLEAFDRLLRRATGAPPNEATIPLTVYMTFTQEGVRSLMNGNSGGAAGFYSSRLRGPVMVAPRTTGSARWDFGVQNILFHEYAHHFMLQHFPAAYPRWYVEGFAEFYSTVAFNGDGTISVGSPLRHRVFSLSGGGWIPYDRMLSGADIQADQFYAQGWLLTHYLTFAKGRSAQLRAYLDAINAGKSIEEAYQAVFAPGYQQLHDALWEYYRGKRYPVLTVAARDVTPGPVTLRSLNDAEAMLLRYDILLDDGLSAERYAAIAAEARADAAALPRQRFEEHIMLARAEGASGNFGPALAAVDAALAQRADHPVALREKGLILLARADAAETPEKAAIAEARSWIVKANRANPDDALALAGYYRTFRAGGETPTEVATSALVRAHELVPQDLGLRIELATELTRVARFDDALFVIKPVMSSPHESALREAATALVASINERLAGRPAEGGASDAMQPD